MVIWLLPVGRVLLIGVGVDVAETIEQPLNFRSTCRPRLKPIEGDNLRVRDLLDVTAEGTDTLVWLVGH